MNLGNTYAALGDLPSALKNLRKGLRVLERELGYQHPSAAIANGNIALVYLKMDQPGPAKDILERVLNDLQKGVGEFHHDVATMMHGLGRAEAAMENWADANAAHMKAAEMRTKIFGNNHPATAVSFGHLGNLYHGLKNYRKAHEMHQKAAEVLEATLGHTHPLSRTAQSNMANALVKLKPGDSTRESVREVPSARSIRAPPGPKPASSRPSLLAAGP